MVVPNEQRSTVSVSQEENDLVLLRGSIPEWKDENYQPISPTRIMSQANTNISSIDFA
jgi:hypothetical protein